MMIHYHAIGYLAFLFKVYWSLRVCITGDITGLFQSLVKPCNVLFHFFKRR